MKNIISRTIALIVLPFALIGCGAGSNIEPQLSTQPTMACSDSAECMAAEASGKPMRMCDEMIHGGKVISTWDNGRTWVTGNCDDTNEG